MTKWHGTPADGAEVARLMARVKELEAEIQSGPHFKPLAWERLESRHEIWTAKVFGLSYRIVKRAGLPFVNLFLPDGTLDRQPSETFAKVAAQSDFYRRVQSEMALSTPTDAKGGPR